MRKKHQQTRTACMPACVVQPSLLNKNADEIASYNRVFALHQSKNAAKRAYEQSMHAETPAHACSLAIALTERMDSESSVGINKDSSQPARINRLALSLLCADALIYSHVHLLLSKGVLFRWQDNVNNR